MKNNAAQIVKILKKTYPHANTALIFKNPMQLLVATILSAQCTDARVNLTTPALFAKYKKVEDFAKAKPADLMPLIRSTGFYRHKAEFIQKSCKKIVEQFGGVVPKTMEEILMLPGVARKTANVVLGTAYGVTEGIAVDTHVIRLSGRLGLSKEKDPVKIEKDLMRQVDRKDWTWFSHAMIQHGRTICKAISPKCGECPLNKICPSAFKFG